MGKHAIIIKNKENKYLQYYDERWQSYLFLNCKINGAEDIDIIQKNVEAILGLKDFKCNYLGMKKQLKSFKAAFVGIGNAVKSEGHLRFLLVAAFYVIVFSFFYDLSKAQWAVVLLLIGAIIAAEFFNTAVENVCDLVTKEYNKRVKTAKDVSAAAVLVLSIAAVVVAFIFYFDLDRIQYIAMYFIARPWLLILFVISLIISVVFIGKFKAKEKK